LSATQMCAAIKRLISIMRFGDKTEFIKRLKTPDLINRNGRIFSQLGQIQMPMDEVPTEEDTPRELPWIESGSLLRDFWSAVEYGGIPEYFGRLKARGHALMAKWDQDILLGKN